MPARAANREHGPKGEASRQALMDAAAQLFAGRGFHATKVSDIVAAAGLTQAAFYLYFESKRAIWDALLAAFAARAAQLSAETRLPPGNDPARLQRSMRDTLVRTFAFLLENPNLTRIVLHAPEAEPLHQSAITMLAANVRLAQRAGQVRADLHPDLWAEMVHAAMLRLTERYLLPGTIAPDDLAGIMINALTYGSLGHPTESVTTEGTPPPPRME